MSPEQELSAEALAVIEKVKKLLALASNNDNEHQAAAASAKAMELLEAYNLDMALVNSSSKSASRADSTLKGGLYSWQRQLWEACARLHFCSYWSIKGLAKGSTYEHRILGRKENVVSARIMAEYLQQTVERLGQDYAKAQGFKSVFVKEAIAYREGASVRLVGRLEDQRRAKIAADRAQARETPSGGQTGTALVLADVIQTEIDLNSDYLNGWDPGTTAARRAQDETRRNKIWAELKAQEEERQQILADPTHPRHSALAAEEERIRRLDEKARADAIKREERNAKRRKGDGFTYRNFTPQEQRARMSSFREGFERGDSVGLDRQINKTNTKGIK